MMRKKGVILMLTALMAVILCGAVSAADSSTTGAEGNLSDSNTSEEVDPILWVTVNYEYTDDVINPEITVTDSNNDAVAFDKTKYSDKLYKLNFTYTGVTNGTQFNVLVKTPGYIDQTQQVEVNKPESEPDFVGAATFNMLATENYKLGRKVTAEADKLLKFADADDVLCITTAGLAYRNGTTTEDCLEGVLNGSHGEISYGQGNLLTFQSIRTDPVDFCFIVRNSSELTAAFFKNGSLTPAYVGSFSAVDQTLWESTLVPALGDNAFGYVSIANAWKEGLSTDILRQAAYHGHVCLGTISGQAMVTLLLKYYPPGVYGDDGELEATSYRAVGVPGNSDDDAFVYSLDLTTGKRSYVGYATAEDTMVGFIRWCAATRKGTLIIMRFNEEAVLQLFKQQTGRTAYSGIAAELLFNAWLVDKFENDPDSLVEILYVFDNITAEVHNNLTGGVESKVVVADALGLDMDYILGLGLTNIADQRVATTYETGNLTPDQIKEIGTKAAEEAIKQFEADGINLMDYKDSSKLTVFTSAGYVRVNGQVMDMSMDGIYEILGSRLSRATLLPVHTARYNPLYFQFSLEKEGSIISKTIYYMPETGTLTTKNESACNIDQVILYDPPYDALMAWLWHNHVCGGSSPGYLITNYIYENFPIGEDESYSLISTSVSCRDDIYTYLLGVSPGAGNYYSQRMTQNSTGSDILILSIFDSKTNTRRVVIINWKNPTFQGDYNSYEEYIKLYWGDYSSPNLKSAPVISLTADTWVTEEEWNTIISGGYASGNALQYIKSLPVRTMADLVPVPDGSGGIPGGSTVPGGSGSGSGGSNSGLTRGTGYGRGSGISPGTIQTTSTVGSESAQGQSGEISGESGGKGYEVTKVGSPGSTKSNILWVIGGVILTGSLAVLGFFKSSILGFLGLK